MLVTRRRVETSWRRRRGRALLAGALLLAFAAGIWLRGTSFFPTARDFVASSPRLASNALAAALARPEPIALRFEPDAWAKLASKRQEALARSYLMAGEDDQVPAVVHYRDRDLRARVRLKGDHLDHLFGDKWSFRVELRDAETVLGMQRFSLHHPATRNYLGEWLFHETLRREGVAALRYEFVTVVVNGKALGIYAIEEHFGPELLARNGLPDGPIVRFNEEHLWREMAQQAQFEPEVRRNGSGEFAAAEVDAFRSGVVLADPVQRQHFLRAVMQLESFRAGRAKTSDVFAIDKLARFFAVTDLLGAEHGARWHNARFLFNPLTGRLEPIGFDGDALTPIRDVCAVVEGVWIGTDSAPPADAYYAKLFADPELLRAWMNAVERLTAPGWLEELLAATAPARAECMAILHKEFPEYEPSMPVLFRNRDYLRSVIQPTRAVLGYAHLPNPLELEIEVAAVQGLPVELLAVVRGEATIHTFEAPRLLPGRPPGAQLSFAHLRVPLPHPVIAAETWSTGLAVRLRIFGSETVRTEAVVPWRRLAADDVAVATAALTEFPCLDLRDGEVWLRSGTWVLDRELVIPAGCIFRAAGGVELDLVRGAVIRSAAPLEWLGEAERPIVLRSSDGSGGGLQITAADRRSVLRHVHCNGLAGGVTLRSTRARLEACEVSRCRAAAAIDVAGGDVELEGCIVRDAHATSLRAVFAATVLRRCAMYGSGTDGIVLRGGTTELGEVTVDGAAGRGLDASEGARVTTHNLHLRRVRVGVASRDLAAVALTDTVLAECGVGFAAFGASFGPAAIEAGGLTLTGVERTFLIERGSSMSWSGKAQPADATDVDRQLAEIR